MNSDTRATDWYHAKPDTPGGQQAGPLTWEQLLALAQAGALAPDDLVWNPSLPQWIPAAQIPGLLPAPTAGFVAAPPPPSAEWAATLATGSPQWPVAPPAPAPALASGRPSRPWLLPLVISLAALVLVGGGLGVYFGLLRDGGGSSATGVTGVTTATTPGTASGAGTTTDTTTEDSEGASPGDTTSGPAGWLPVDSGAEVPSPRMSSAMVHEAGAGTAILFGGVFTAEEEIFDYDDTWGFDTATGMWTNLDPAGDRPTARDGHAMAYDSREREVILFGGIDGFGAWLDDTWAYDSLTNNWGNLDPAGERPAARMGHAVVYDPAARRVILFGGIDEIDTYFDDTWAYDFATNTWTALNPGGDVPIGRYGHTMVYDPETERVLLFGGWGNDGNFNDTWAYDSAANTWTELQPAGSVPANRAAQTMVYDAARARVLLMGGWGDDAFFNDTWAYDSAANTWTELDPGGGEAPPARAFASAAYDPDTGSTVLFGGYEGDVQMGDTWVYGVSSSQGD